MRDFVCWNCALDGDSDWAARHRAEAGHTCERRVVPAQEHVFVAEEGARVVLLDSGRTGTVFQVIDGGFYVQLDGCGSLTFCVMARRIP